MKKIIQHVVSKPDQVYLVLSAVFFILLAFAYLMIVMFELPLQVGGFVMPVWSSQVGFLFAVFFSVRGFASLKKKQ